MKTKNLKRLLACALAMALLLISAVPAFAEEASAAQTTQSETQAQEAPTQQASRSRSGGRNSSKGGKPGIESRPQAPGKNGGAQQKAPSSDAEKYTGPLPTLPATGESDASQSARKEKKPGSRKGKSVLTVDQIPFESLLKDGVISQETYDAIIAYLQENMPEALPAAEESGTPDAPATTTAPEDSTPPTEPTAPVDGKVSTDIPDDKPAGDTQTKVLDELLGAQVITQAEYDAITGALATAAPET